MFLKSKLAATFSIVLSAFSVSSTSLSAVLSLCAGAPAFAQMTNSQGRTVMIPAGTTFEGRIDSTLSSSKSHAGDRFNVTMSSPVLANGTDVVIPAGSQIVGEVVEAISSGHQPHEKKQHLNGKLRVQLTALKTPDGMTYPLIGEFVGERSGKGSSVKTNPDLGTGIAYIGSQNNFNAVYPNARANGGGGGRRGPQLVTRKQMMADPLLGDPDKKDSAFSQAGSIRSIVLVKHELYIHSGSPMSIRLDAPLKMAIAPIGGMSQTQFSQNQPAEQAPQAPSRPNFSRPRSAIAAPPTPAAEQQQQAPQAVAPQAPPATSNGPSFLDPVPGARPAPSRPQWNPQSFSAPSAPAAPAQSAPQSSGFNTSTSPAEQSAAAQSTGSFNASPATAPAAPSFGSFSPPPAAAAIPAQSFGSLNAAPAAAAPGQSFGALNAAPAAQAAMPAQSLGSLNAAPAAQAAMPVQSLGSLNAAPAAAAQSLFGDPAPAPTAPAVSKAPPVTATPSVHAPASSLAPAAPPPNQSLDTFINSLGSKAPAAEAPAPAAATPAAPAPPAAATAATPATPTASAPTFSQPAASAPAAPAFARQQPVSPAAAPKSAPGDNF